MEKWVKTQRVSGSKGPNFPRLAQVRISVKAATRFGMNPATCFG